MAQYFSPSPALPKPTDTSQDSTSLPEFTDSDVDALLGEFPAAPSSPTNLVAPLALPQTSLSYDAPFLRAYSTELNKAGIPQEHWLRFQDGLNLAMVRLDDCLSRGKPFTENDFILIDW